MSVLRLFLLVSLLALSTFVGSARAEWLKGESEHFIVYGDTSERQMRAYVQKIERFDQVLRAYYPKPNDFVSPKLPIYIAKSKADMRAVWPTLPSTVGGFYSRQDERIFAMATDDGEGDSVLFHEYAHHFMFQNLTAAYPAWFVEGFAEYYATIELRSDRVKIGLFSPGRMNSLSGGLNQWAPMEAILTQGRPGSRPIIGHKFYAQSWALTHYLLSTPERQAMMAAYFRAIWQGAEPADAVQSAMGRTPQQLQTDLYRYISGPITNFTPQRDFPPAEVVISRLSPAERDAMWLDLRLARFVPEELRAANLAEAQRLAARHPGEPLSAQALAQAYLDMKQPADAVATLTPVVDSHPNNVQSLRMLANSLMDQGDALTDDPTAGTALYVKARQFLARAYQLEATDYRVYLAMARNREGAPGYPTLNDVEVLKFAAELAPQLPSVRLKAATAMMHHDQFEDAILMLLPISSDSHGGTGTGPARDLLSRAYAGAGRAVPEGLLPSDSTIADFSAGSSDKDAAED
jgi:tetratricopeptide (TPR) repeat protein